MNRTALMRFAFGVALLMVVILALTACGSGSAQEEAKGRPLPLYENALSPGEYHTVEFKPPLSFEVSEPWSSTTAQLSDWIELGYEGQTGFITFVNAEEVFKPGTTEVVDAPKDLVGWLQEHPYLKTSKPQPVTVGGVKGEQLDVLVEDLPKDYSVDPECSDCVDIAPLSNDQEAAIFGLDPARWTPESLEAKPPRRESKCRAIEELATQRSSRQRPFSWPVPHPRSPCASSPTRSEWQTRRCVTGSSKHRSIAASEEVSPPKSARS